MKQHISELVKEGPIVRRNGDDDGKEYVTIDGTRYELGAIMPWYVNPVHVGWYMREYGGEWTESLDYYDGEHWHYGDYEGLYEETPVALPLHRWRGIAINPNLQTTADAIFDEAAALMPTTPEDPSDADVLHTSSPEDSNINYHALSPTQKLVSWGLSAIIAVVLLCFIVEYFQ